MMSQPYNLYKHKCKCKLYFHFPRNRDSRRIHMNNRLAKKPEIVARGCCSITNATCIYNKSDIERCGYRGEELQSKRSKWERNLIVKYMSERK